MRAYAIGDIHGHLGKLKEAHALIAEDRAHCGDTEAPVVHVGGDLVDRGPDSRGVIQYLLDGQVRGENWVVLKGNHDRMAALFLRDVPQVDPQLLLDHYWCHPRIGGGVETLASYGGVQVPPQGGVRTYQLHADAWRKCRRYTAAIWTTCLPCTAWASCVSCTRAFAPPAWPWRIRPKTI